MDIFSNLDYKLTSIRKFYFLEYFYILLYSIDKYEDFNSSFESFKILKEKFQLGESKYKLSARSQNLEGKLENRYIYTFNQVFEEAVNYDFVDKSFKLTSRGKKLLEIYHENDKEKFYLEIFRSIEEKTYGFNFLINFCYRVNPDKGGLIILPIYSPLKLGLEKSDLKSGLGIFNYMKVLTNQLEQDLNKFLNKHYHLYDANQKLLDNLIDSELIGDNLSD